METHCKRLYLAHLYKYDSGPLYITSIEAEPSLASWPLSAGPEVSGVGLTVSGACQPGCENFRGRGEVVSS